MHPPFYVVDHKVGPENHNDYSERTTKRRTQPQRLQISPVASSWPPVPFIPEVDTNPQLIRLPSGMLVAEKPRLQIVPAPQRSLRHVIGRWLIRIGQRMILENRPG
ncbi:hypothetical protein CLV80_110101 [Yoonia maritima]|uniref:Uncharacterized protein n=1 Tax=Yoonia maritima TaxID=1435347 RepID=A0A2T0VW27_9RHOB|nr:hypothetical protein CLV80_110101 [Yoonia maritima]